LDPKQYRLIHRTNAEVAEPLLAHGVADVCIADVDLTGVQSAWSLEKLKRKAPDLPLIVYTSARQWEWEEEAYLRGATCVLSKPVRPRTLQAVLERVCAPPAIPVQPQVAIVRGAQPSKEAPPPAATPGAAHTLSVLRNCSIILGYSLDAEAMLRQFLLLLREILSINRAAVFLRKPGSVLGCEDDSKTGGLQVACSVGLSASLLQHFELSFHSGIGASVFRSGHILRRDSEEAMADPESSKEFELLGAQVAIPILDRESVLGVALFDGRITGEPLVSSELQLVFHLLEQLGLAIRNIWLHDQVAANHELMTGVMRELNSACVVVGSDLSILHANKMARRCFSKPERRGELEFSDLPQGLGAKVYQVLQHGAALSNYSYQSEDTPDVIYNVNIVPFGRQTGGATSSALLIAEDQSQAQVLKRLEIESANLRLVRDMAQGLTHEMGNALTRLSTYQQLLGEQLVKDEINLEFLKAMETDSESDLRRIARLVSQMRHLSTDALPCEDNFPLEPLVQEAYQEACKLSPTANSKMVCESGGKPLLVNGNRAALRHALTEVILNGLQASPSEPGIVVRLRADAVSNGNSGLLQIEVQDEGPGFTPEAVSKATLPFFTTRNVGLGLGLTVCRKIVETHHGKVEIPPTSGKSGRVNIFLPPAHSGREALS
jgi:signal transduction histidine kinase/CheY-like chemotaxis protein